MICCLKWENIAKIGIQYEKKNTKYVKIKFYNNAYSWVINIILNLPIDKSIKKKVCFRFYQYNTCYFIIFTLFNLFQIIILKWNVLSILK